MISRIGLKKTFSLFSSSSPSSCLAPLNISTTRFIAKRFASDEQHHEESFEEYTARYVKFFDKEADDVFELSRGLNNAFNTDIVPAPEVLTAAIKCARRLNSYPLASRTVEALKEKLKGDEKVYQAYLDELKPLMTELGIATPEELGR